MSLVRLRTVCNLIEAVNLERNPTESYEFNHSGNTGTLTRMLAESLGYTGEILEIIYLGACLHDMGKLAVARGIVNKPGILNSEEWEEMKQHTVKGYHIFSKQNFESDINTIVLPMIRSHHERWDGTGYPDGLKGEAIPIWARLVSIADTCDALTSPRPQRMQPMLQKDALDHMMEQYNQFDPSLMAAFVKMMTNGGSKIIKSSK